ncbi:Phage minor tail protein [Lachnospiraceae bacterium TWA4]|nr:Phage minor tail protein [Lachnospiraceae bacterium TWA4]
MVYLVKWFGGIGKVAVKAGKAIAVGAVAGTTALTALGTKAVQSYADYEQLVGGVETLFGAGGQSLEEYAKSVGKTTKQAKSEYDNLMKAQNNVLKNADNAYKTAGMSANEYMETVTSFSASLIQSLGGDTVKASDVANRAIVDMSDNANKMGTSMELIQNAYNGFAKQNYTMLDNLKLGYGGTQAEMKRLIKDASKMTDVQKDLNLTVKDGDMSFGNIVNAISVMQSSLGIAGTTAKEAGSTISGSIGMMKSAWENFTTGLADGDQNIDQLMNNLIDSVMTVADNLVPRIVELLPRLVDGTTRLIQGLSAKLPSVLNQLLPPLIAGATQLMQSLANALPSLMNVFAKLLPTLISGIINIAISIASQLPSLVQPIIQVLPAILDSIVQAIISKLPPDLQSKLKSALGNLSDIWESLKQGAEKAKEVLGKVVDKIQEFSGVIPYAIGLFVAFKGAMMIQGAVNAFQEAQVAIALLTAQTEGANLAQLALNGTMTIGETIVALLTGKMTLAQLAQAGLAKGQAVLNAVMSANPIGIVITLIAGLVIAFVALWNKSESFRNFWINLWENIKSITSSVINALKNLFTNGFNAIKNIVNTVLNTIKSIISTVLNAVKSVVSSRLNAVKSTFTSIWNGIKSIVSNVINGIKSTISNGLNGAKSAVTNVLNAIKNKFKSILDGAYNIVKNAINKIKSVFNFSWSLPKLKLPHFSVSGSFSLNPPSIPKFGVSWYKKAMDNPYMFTSPTIFGYDAATGQAKGAGEAGDEMIYGKRNLMNDISESVSLQNKSLIDTINTKFEKLFEILAKYFPEFANIEVVLDDGTLVGKITPKVDRNLGIISIHKGRGN